MLDSTAITKIQTIILVAIIVVAAVGGAAAYVWFSGEDQSSETIKIGILADLDMPMGINSMRAAILAAEQINAEGGILGKQIEIVGEDSDVDTDLDPTKLITTLVRLITYRKADFVIVAGGETYIIDSGVEHKKIIFGTISPAESLAQRVIDDYDKYKYFFRLRINETAFAGGFIETILHLREITGFNKVAYLVREAPQTRNIWEAFDALPEDHGFELVYRGKHPSGTFDFTSYFAAAEAAGAEIMVPFENGQTGVALALEWYNRQSPMVLWGSIAYLTGDEVWEGSEGKVNHMTLFQSSPLKLGLELTSKTSATQEAYMNRWGELPGSGAMVVYDCIRFLLYDALERAKTTETEAVIKALEESEIENSLTENFKFTSSHDRYHVSGEGLMFQWQTGGIRAIVFPKEMMEETGATYTYPDWPGPWD